MEQSNQQNSLPIPELVVEELEISADTEAGKPSSILGKLEIYTLNSEQQTNLLVEYRRRIESVKNTLSKVENFELIILKKLSVKERELEELKVHMNPVEEEMGMFGPDVLKGTNPLSVPVYEKLAPVITHLNQKIEEYQSYKITINARKEELYNELHWLNTAISTIKDLEDTTEVPQHPYMLS